jgi:hypothetical protein
MHNPPMTSPRLATVAAVAAALALAAIGCGGATDDRPARWSFISATIMEPSCATVNCHSAITHQGGVDLSAREIGYQSLVPTFFVFPGDPQNSPVVNLMNAVGSIRMPPDNPLPEADIVLIEKWIADGAQDN